MKLDAKSTFLVHSNVATSTTAMDCQFDQVLPGDHNFYDVTQIFADAAADMPSGGLVLAKDFTLQDAMAAFEIGEPRFDSGLALMDQTRPVFDPLEPLLPEEVCWMIDRSFACEMQWHTGYTLSQTIFSFLHVHALRETDPELIPADQIGEVDHTRPLELVTIVLRAYVYGLLKSCDLSWRELNKGNVYDAEDWQSEKCDVPLAEAIPVTYIQAELERACTWLDGSFQASSTWKDALRDRLVLRKTLIELLLAQLTKEYNRFPLLVNTARQLVQKIRQTPPPEPGPDSPASRAFDPQFARVLVSFIPLHDIRLPDQDTVWNKLVVLLDSLDQLSTLAGVSDLSTWKIMGHVQSWLSKPDRRLPYIRSACQSTLFEDGLVFNKYTQKHVVDCFFMENCEISYDSFIDMVGRRWKGPQVSPLAHLERSIIELELGYIKALWYNPARRRRYCMKSLFDWHALYALLLDIKNNFEPWPDPDPLPRVCTIVLVRRLSVIREVIYSGTQLSLYSAEERVFAYWYASQVLDMQLSCMDELIPGLQGSPAFDEYQFQSIFLTALQAISLVVFSVSLKNLGTSWQRMRLNCIRRYKWAFIDEYDDIEQLPIGHPNFLKFTAACSTIQQDRDYSPVGQIRLAGVLLEELVTSSEGWTGPWVEERKQSIQRLRDVCQSLEKLPASMSEASVWDMSVLTWDPDVHPWFPDNFDLEVQAQAGPSKTRKSHRVKPESTDAETPGPSDSRRGARSTAKKSKPATRQPSVKSELLEEGDADHDASPQKPKPKRKSKQKAVTQRLETPHPTPADWANAYAAIKAMRARIVAPVDTMGCDRAQFGEREPKNQRFATLVSLMLSSQTKDEVTDTAVAKLRTALGGALSVQAVLDADEAVISEAIAKVGFWRRKTQYIKQTAQRLHDAFDADVPKTVEELCSLPGVGPKMAFLTLQVAWHLNVGIGVDVHVHRITNRLGWHVRPTKNPEKTRVNLESWLPKDLHGEINHLLVGFGQTICLPVGPKCGDCTLSAAGLCPSAQSAKTRTKTSKTAVRTGSGSPKEEDVQEGSGPKMEIKMETERPRDRENMESGLVKEEV
ncbi:hypothetical protein JVT61DRAFT_2681 [Boletus reticuloceps]|uniref:Endonuclease III homolog n=1 Tax=Boletus reticuloceps TaxID=495285 RepID=A0A8I2YPK3_9AGAM|nr:hypothetical protein JVT61DRAFT_2681 [Boletus reticuloceps]